MRKKEKKNIIVVAIFTVVVSVVVVSVVIVSVVIVFFVVVFIIIALIEFVCPMIALLVAPISHFSNTVPNQKSPFPTV